MIGEAILAIDLAVLAMLQSDPCKFKFQVVYHLVRFDIEFGSFVAIKVTQLS